MSEADLQSDVAALTVQLLSAYLANNTVASEELAELIRSTKAALTGEVAAVPAEPEVYTPAVSVRKSLASPEHIISLIDGKPYKTLKRHLTSHGLTPDDYRSRYGLPASYPIVAPAYAEHRRVVAQRIGLGSKRSKPEPDADEIATADAALSGVEAASTIGDAETKPSKQATGRKSKPAKKAQKPAPEQGAILEQALDTPRGSGELQPDVNVGAISVVGTSEPTDLPVDESRESADDAVQPAKRTRATADGKTASKSPKAQARSRKASKIDEPAVDGPSNPSSVSDASHETEVQAPKRRGRIGLFGKSASKPDEQAEAAKPATGKGSKRASAGGGEASVSAKGPEKPKRPQRMARAAKTIAETEMIADEKPS